MCRVEPCWRPVESKPLDEEHVEEQALDSQCGVCMYEEKKAAAQMTSAEHEYGARYTVLQLSRIATLHGKVINSLKRIALARSVCFPR